MKNLPVFAEEKTMGRDTEDMISRYQDRDIARGFGGLETLEEKKCCAYLAVADIRKSFHVHKTMENEIE